MITRNTHRKFQNIRLPFALRPKPQQTSVARVVREIEPSPLAEYSEQGRAVLFGCDALVATRDGSYWVVLELQEAVSYGESASQN